MIHTEKKYLKIILKILSKYPYKFYVFGSRARGDHRKLSDLDLCYYENIPLNIISHIREDFEESNLPYTVDLVNWNTCDTNFQTLIKPDLIEIKISAH